MYDKKGYIYVITTSFLVTAILILLLIQNYSYEERQESESRRIKVMNDFVKSFNKDLERAINIASFRTLISLEDHVASTGRFLEDTEEHFKETVYNGTINGTQAFMMRNSSIKDYLEKTNWLASSFGMSMNVTIENITLSHVSPWIISVSLDANINVYDNTNLAIWQYQETFSSNIPIDNLRDPLYSVYTNNRLPNPVTRFENETLVTENNDTTNLVEVLENSYYIEAPNLAPSFIQRFSNNWTENIHGIQSVVDIESISDQEIIIYENRIKVDFIYFNDLSRPKACDFDDALIPEDVYLVIPTNNLALYQLENVSHSTTCP